MLCCIAEIHLIGTNAETAYHNQILGFSQHSSSELGLGADANDMDVSCYIFQPRKSPETVTASAYRIFSINCSSAREDFKNST